MKTIDRRTACAAVLAAAATGAARAQGGGNAAVPVIDGPTYVMTYVEVMPSKTTDALATLRAYRDASRKEPGVLFADVYQEQGQSHRFVLGEVWQNRGAVQSHRMGAAMASLLRTLEGMELGPTDMRIHQAFSATPPKAPTANGIVVISHCDVAGGNTQNLMRAFEPLSEGSRRDAGMLRYEILDEVPAHSNHFRLVEEWASLADFEAHARAPHTLTYRRTILPWLGTPYDQRLYTLVS